MEVRTKHQVSEQGAQSLSGRGGGKQATPTPAQGPNLSPSKSEAQEEEPDWLDGVMCPPGPSSLQGSGTWQFDWQFH